MSSLQKFHRRTNMPVAATGWVRPTDLTDGVITKGGANGAGTALTGRWFGVSGGWKLYMHPTDSGSLAWGSNNILRGATCANNGWANTNQLFNFGTTGHPAANWCTSLTTGGYNTWYMPAKNELHAHKSSGLGLLGNMYYWCSTEINATNPICIHGLGDDEYTGVDKNGALSTRAVRRSTV